MNINGVTFTATCRIDEVDVGGLAYYLLSIFFYLDDDISTYPVFRNYNMSRISAPGYSTFDLFSSSM
jgi:hypothetical protein